MKRWAPTGFINYPFRSRPQMHLFTAPAVRSGPPTPQRRTVGRAVSRRVRLASLLLAVALVAPSSAHAARLGSNTVGAKVQRNDAGQAKDYRLATAAPGRVSRLSV